MEFINCRSCGRLYQYFGGQGLCSKCASILEERFMLVREYIYDHPEAPAQEVAEEFGISVHTIIRWVREERLAFSEKSAFGLPCEYCKEKIKFGRYCTKCKVELKNRFSAVYKMEQEKKEQRQKELREGNKMHFLQEL